MDVLEANNEKFLNWTKQQANAKLKQPNFKLKDIVCVKFVRGKDMAYKLSHEENDSRELDFLKKKNDITSFPAKTTFSKNIKFKDTTTGDDIIIENIISCGGVFHCLKAKHFFRNVKFLVNPTNKS